MDTGKALYHNCLIGGDEDLLWIRASASMPVASRPVILHGRRLSDGGTANAVPLDFMMHKGIQKNVVILTQPDSYRKEQMKHFWLIKLMLWRYPALVRALKTRPARYNRNIDFVETPQVEFCDALVTGAFFSIALSMHILCRSPPDK